MVPGKVREAAAVGRQPRGGEEVVASGKHLSGGDGGAVCVECNDGVDGLAACGAMIFPNTDPAVMAAVDEAIRVTEIVRRSERHGLARGGVEAIEAAVGIVGKVKRAVVDGPGAAAIFVDA